MFNKLFKTTHSPLIPADFSKLSARFVRSLAGTFTTDQPLRLWPLSDNREVILRRFWDSACVDFSQQAVGYQPDNLTMEMMREDDYLMGLLLLPTMEGSASISAALWLFGPVAFEDEDPYAQASARFFAMAEDKGTDSEAQLYELVNENLVESGQLASPDTSLFVETIIERHLHNQAIFKVKSGAPDMTEAMRSAMAQVPYFVEILENYPSVNKYSVKIKVVDGEAVEYFWLENTLWQGAKFHGTLGNDPTRVTTVTYGQPITVGSDEIVDWYYMWEGKMRGNYTLRVGLPYMDPQQAAKLMAILDEQ